MNETIPAAAAAATLEGKECLTGKAFVEKLRAELIEPGIRRLLSRPFFAELAAGTLSRRQLQGFAIQHYLHNQAICYGFSLAILKHSHDPRLARYFTRQFVEESSTPREGGHPGLAIKLGKALGLTEQDFTQASPILECAAHTGFVLRGILLGSPAENRASALMNESLVCAYSRCFLEALTTHYGLTRDDCEFFTVHMVADLEHTELAATTIEQFATSPQMQLRTRNTAEQALELKVMKFDGIYTRYRC